MTISFYTPLKGDLNGRFKAMWEKIDRFDFNFPILQIIDFIPNNKISNFPKN